MIPGLVLQFMSKLIHIWSETMTLKAFKAPAIYLAIFVLVGMLSGCAAATTLAPTALPTATSIPIASPSLTPTFTPTETLTFTPTITFTPTATTTLTLIPTDTLTPTRTPTYNMPGDHPVGRCTDLPLRYTYGTTVYDGIVNLCLIDVLVRDDYKMQFNLVWHFASKDLPVPHRYVFGNLDTMHLVDDLGNRYDPLGNSGKTQDTDAPGAGENSIAAYYLFPRPTKGARVFTLVDDDKNRSINLIILIYR
jgi:outer membrane receptor protein involved in Fe transport